MPEAVSLIKWPGDQEGGFVRRGTALGTYVPTWDQWLTSFP